MLSHVTKKKYKTNYNGITMLIGGFRRFRSIFIQEEGRAVARKKIWMKKFNFKQIATWVKPNLGLCVWIPIVIPIKGTLYGPIRSTIGTL